jgi:L,D-transpeptidase-like protein
MGALAPRARPAGNESRTWLQPKICLGRLSIATAGLALVMGAGDLAEAAKARSQQRQVASIETRDGGEPLMAVVSLRSQQITVYDADGWILRSPVSSGQKGRETPAGIFSVIQKQAEHYSNLYDDAFMPHMHRLTWSGIALHGGVVPAHPASHGCIRLPFDFAERLFEISKVGMRVIVSPGDIAPVAIADPALFQPKADIAAVAATRAAEAEQAAAKAERARLAAVAAGREAAQAMTPVRMAENLKFKAETQLAAAERAAAAATSDEAKEQTEDARTKAAARVAELADQLAAAKAELQPKLDAVARARDAAVAAHNESVAAAEAARQTARNQGPISVFISRKTQHLYVRQGFRPILDVPVTIQDPDRPIGTHVFTVMERSGNDNEMRWSVVSLYGSRQDDGTPESRDAASGTLAEDTETIPTDPGPAKAALDRIGMPEDTRERIAELVSPRSSLIISDEPSSRETGQGTDFVVLLSGEPQGGIKNRRRGLDYEARYWRPRGFSSWRGGGFFTW